jgi:hypothetical protein
MKDIKDYLHLYKGAVMSTPYGECKFVYYKDGIDEKQYNPVVVDRGDNQFAFNLKECKLQLRPLTVESMSHEEAVECIKTFDSGVSDNPEFKIIGKEDGDFIYVEVGYEETECCWTPKTNWLNAEIFQYLLSKGFDLFGLIESGLAIEKVVSPTLMKEKI